MSLRLGCDRLRDRRARHYECMARYLPSIQGRQERTAWRQAPASKAVSSTRTIGPPLTHGDGSLRGKHGWRASVAHLL